MVVIGLFSFFIVILTQFLLKATELWRYTESETEINVQAQTIFATMDNLFEQIFIPEKLPTPEKSIKELKKKELKKIEGGNCLNYLKKYNFSCKKMLDISYNIML